LGWQLLQRIFLKSNLGLREGDEDEEEEEDDGDDRADVLDDEATLGRFDESVSDVIYG
jgi:hypothetical protein